MTAIVLLSSLSRAGDEHNHIHLDQVANGASDNLNLSIDQIGYENLIRFSFNHNDNINEIHNDNDDETNNHTIRHHPDNLLMTKI